MKKKLFNGAVLFHPTDEDTQLLLLKMGFLAISEESAKIELLRELAVNSTTCPSDRLEVVVRPF